MTVVSSEIIAHECLAVLTTPLLSRFLEIVKRETDAWADSVVERLKSRAGEAVPELWPVRINSADAPALMEAGLPVPLDDHLADILLDAAALGAGLPTPPPRSARVS